MQPSGARDADRLHRALVVGDPRRGQALDRVARHRPRVAERHVDGDADRSARAGEIGHDLAVADLDCAGERERPVLAFDVDAIAVDRPRAAARSRRASRARTGRGSRRPAASRSSRPYSSMNSLSMRPPTVVQATLAMQVADRLLGHAHVGAHDLEQQLVGRPARQSLTDGMRRPSS